MSNSSRNNPNNHIQFDEWARQLIESSNEPIVLIPVQNDTPSFHEPILNSAIKTLLSFHFNNATLEVQSFLDKISPRLTHIVEFNDLCTSLEEQICSEILAGNSPFPSNSDVEITFVDDLHGGTAFIQICVHLSAVDKQSLPQTNTAREIFNIFFDYSPDAIVITDKFGKYQQVNDAACKLLGYSRSKLLNMSVQDIATPPSDKPTSIQFQEYILESSMVGDFTFISGSGNVKIAEFTAFQLDDAMQISILRDRTQEKIQQERHQILDTALSQTSESIIITAANKDKTGDNLVIYVSDAFKRLTGYTPDDQIDIVPIFLHGTGSAAENWNNFRIALSKGQPVHSEIRCFRKEGSEFWCEIDISPIKNEDGVCVYYTTILKDISTRIFLENEIARNMEEETQFSKMLSQLHEINLVLARCQSVDDLCREAVNNALNELRLGRVGIWFLSTDHQLVRGTFGTDEQGHLRDERDCEWSFDIGSHSEKSVRMQNSFSVENEMALLDHQGNEVGRGSQIIAPIWIGGEILGFVAVDNLLTGLPFTEKICEITRLFTNTIGHLYAVLITKQTLEESELRYRKLFEGFPSASVVYDKGTMMITDMNMSALSKYNYSRDDLLSMRFIDLEVEPTDPRQQEQLSMILNTRIQDIRLHRTKDGQLIDFKISSQEINISGVEACLVTMEDITALKTAIAQVNKNEKRIQALLDHSTEGYVVLDSDSRVIDASKSLLRLSGYTIEDFQSPSYSTISHPDDALKVHNAIDTVKQEYLSSCSIEFRAKHKENRWMWIEATFSNLLEDENIAGIVMNFREITEKKQAEEEKNRIFELSGSLIIIYNHATQSLLLNPAWKRELGWSISQVKEIGLQNLVHPEEREVYTIYFGSNDVHKTISDFECRLRCIDGTYVWLNWNSQIIEGVLYATAHNVTRTKKMQRELQQSSEQNRQILESISEAFIGLDLNWNFTYINNHAEVLLRRKRETLLGKNLWEEYPDAVNTIYDLEYRKATETGIPNTFEAYFPPFDAWFDVHLYPHDNGLSIYFQNVSEKHKEKDAILDQNFILEEKVRERTLQLTNAMKELESFSYSISHDLRAPLRSISGYARILEDGHKDSLNSEALNCISVIRKGVNQMGLLIDEILEFSRLGRKEIKKSQISLNPLIEDIVNGLQSEERHVDVIIHPLPDCVGDIVLIKQVYVNLISNAFKFTKYSTNPHITVGVKFENNETVYYVQDNGAGFDMRYVHKLFGVFQRLHRAEDYEGTGVGLAIVQRIIEKHNGRVWANGISGKGATFSFTLGTD